MEWNTGINRTLAVPAEYHSLREILSELYSTAKRIGAIYQTSPDSRNHDGDYFLQQFPISYNSEQRLAVKIVTPTESPDRFLEPEFAYRDASENCLNICIVCIANNAFYDTLATEHPEELKYVSLGLSTRRQHKVRVYKVNENILTIFTNEAYNSTLLRHTISVLPTIFPEWFAPLNIPNELFKSLLQDKDVWFSHLQKWLESTNALQDYAEKQIVQLMENLQQQERTNVREHLTRINNGISRTTQELETMYSNLHTTRLKLIGLENQDNAALTELFDYCKRRAAVQRLYAHSGSLGMTISTVYNCDESILSTLLNSGRCRWSTNLRCVLKAIFLDKKYVLYFKAPVYLDIMHNCHNTICEDFKERTEGVFGFDNPHLYHHNCWGSSGNYINKALAEQSYIVALEQTITAVGNINWADGTVVDEFVEDITCIIQHNPEMLCCLDENKNQVSLKTILEREMPNETNPSV